MNAILAAEADNDIQSSDITSATNSRSDISATLKPDETPKKETK